MSKHVPRFEIKQDGIEAIYDEPFMLPNLHDADSVSFFVTKNDAQQSPVRVSAVVQAMGQTSNKPVNSNLFVLVHGEFSQLTSGAIYFKPTVNSDGLISVKELTQVPKAFRGDVTRCKLQRSYTLPLVKGNSYYVYGTEEWTYLLMADSARSYCNIIAGWRPSEDGLVRLFGDDVDPVIDSYYPADQHGRPRLVIDGSNVEVLLGRQMDGLPVSRLGPKTGIPSADVPAMRQQLGAALKAASDLRSTDTQPGWAEFTQTGQLPGDWYFDSVGYVFPKLYFSERVVGFDHHLFCDHITKQLLRRVQAA